MATVAALARSTPYKIDGRHQAVSRPGPRLIPANPGCGLVPAPSRPADDRGPAVRETRARFRPAVYRAAAPAIRTIGHGSGQSSQNPSLLPARRLTGLLAGRIRLALRRRFK